MQSSVVRSGFLFVRFSLQDEKKPPEKYYIELSNEEQQGRPCLLIYKDARKASNCLYMILDLDVKEAVQWRGKEPWERHSLKIATLDGGCVLSAADEEELYAWLQDIRMTLLPSPSFQESTRMPLQGSPLRENQSYWSTFLVMPDSETSARLQARGFVRLAIEVMGVTLTSAEGRLIALFPLKVVRRFGYTWNEFKIWSGRACMHGEGLFSFRTNQAREIADCITDLKQILKCGLSSPPEAKSPKPCDAEEHIYEEPAYLSLPFLLDARRIRPSSEQVQVPAASTSAAGPRPRAFGEASLPREHEWQFKTMMLLELVKEFCKGDSRRYCEVLNRFLERNGMTPLEWDF